MDKMFKVHITGYVIQKDYMSHPELWDWSDWTTTCNDFLDVPEILVTEMVELNQQGILDWRGEYI